MSDDAADVKAKLRETQGKLKAAEKTIASEKGRRNRTAIWSAIGGFVLFAVGGQWVPGYQLDSTAEVTAKKVSAGAVSDLMAQFCVQRFMDDSGLEDRLAALDKVQGDWSKASYIRDGTWANSPDGESADHQTAEKCRNLIGERVAGEPNKTS